jgi:hypothetical protein
LTQVSLGRTGENISASDTEYELCNEFNISPEALVDGFYNFMIAHAAKHRNTMINKN